jgi:alpha-L-fucosidase
MIRELQPQIIVDDRLDLLDVPGGWDYRTPEQTMPREWVSMDGKPVPWETCQTFSGSWGYHRDEATWKSVRQLIVMLIETVSKGGNLLLNVGPTARGTFDERAKERLEGIGAWMKDHDRSITACTQAPADLKAPRNCLLTYNPAAKRLYVHILEWPMGVLHLDGFAGRVNYAQLLNDASEVKFSEDAAAKTLTLQLPMLKPRAEVPVVELYLN